MAQVSCIMRYVAPLTDRGGWPWCYSGTLSVIVNTFASDKYFCKLYFFCNRHTDTWINKIRHNYYNNSMLLDAQSSLARSVLLYMTGSREGIVLKVYSRGGSRLEYIIVRAREGLGSGVVVLC